MMPSSIPLSRQPTISVILPARNEAGGIERAVRRARAVLLELGVSFEIIVGDSGSTDGTGAVARGLPFTDVRVVRCDRPGKGRILSRAMAEARGDLVGFLDSDLEIAAEYLIPAVEAIREGADGAIASKVLTPDQGPPVRRKPLRRMNTDLANRAVRRLLGTPYSDHQAGMKVFRRDVLLPALVHVRATGWLWDSELLCLLYRGGHTIQEVPVSTSPGRPSGFGTLRQWTAAALELCAVCWRAQRWDRSR